VPGGLALCLALLINQRLRGINFYRAIYFMPVVVSIVVVSLLFRFIYDGNDGLLNNILGFLSFGLFEGRDWLGSEGTALGAIMGMSVWQAVGFHMVIWLSGLQTISPTLYEASSIEGASKWQTFRYVTWPGLRNTAVLVLIVITMQAFALFAQVDVMTRGGPLDSTTTIVFQAVERGYGKQDNQCRQSRASSGRSLFGPHTHSDHLCFPAGVHGNVEPQARSATAAGYVQYSCVSACGRYQL
jgi:multiple sugar transport system permease protein